MTTRKAKAASRIGSGPMLYVSALAIAGGLLCPSAASAQTATTPPADANSGLEEITVTAQRRTETINKVPISISALNAEDIQRQNIRGIDDVLTAMPNVSFVSQGSRDRKEISIRGISNQLDPYRDGRQQEYAFYIDEFNVAVGTSNPEIVDLDRIEVLRGPQGTYFGRNSVGGAVNITTKKPTNDFYAEIGGGYASYNTKNIDGIVNIPLVKDKLALRVVGQYRDTDGWIKNINPIGGGNDGDFEAARATLRYTPTDRATLDLTYSYMRGKEGMRVGVPTGFVTATWADVYYGKSAGFVADPDGVGFYPNNWNKVNFNRPQAVGTRMQYASAHFTYDFDKMVLTAVAGTLDNHLYNKGDVDGGSYDYFYENRLIHRTSTSGEIRLQSRDPQTLEWSIGSMVGRDTGHLNALTYNGSQSPFGAEGTAITGAFTNSHNTYWAVFGQATLNLFDHLKLIAGGRYSWEKAYSKGTTYSSEILTDSNDRSATFTDFSPRFTASYDTTKFGMVYATVSKGFKAGGVQTSGSSALNNNFKPETLWNYEVGWKADLFDKHLRMNVSAFYMDWKDVQEYISFQYLDANGLLRKVTTIQNATSARSKGIEAGLDALLTRGLKIGGSVGYLNAKYKKWTDALIDGSVIDASGKPLINAPKWTLSAYGEYDRPVAAGLDGFVRAEWTYRSKQLTDPLALLYNQWPLIAPGYQNTNLRAGISTDRWSATVYVENLFNKHYFNSAYEQAFYSGVQVEPSVRHVGVDFKVKFGRDKQ